MKKLLNSVCFVMLMTSAFAYANPVANKVPVTDGQVTVESPRTGIQYTVPNPNQRPVVIKTKAIEAANSGSAERIVASNPALSPESQETAKNALIDLVK